MRLLWDISYNNLNFQKRKQNSEQTQGWTDPTPVLLNSEGFNQGAVRSNRRKRYFLKDLFMSLIIKSNLTKQKVNFFGVEMEDFCSLAQWLELLVVGSILTRSPLYAIQIICKL